MTLGKIINKIVADELYNSLKKQIKELDTKANETNSYSEKIKYTEKALELSVTLYNHSQSNGYSDYWTKNNEFDPDKYEVKNHRELLEFYKIRELYEQALSLEKENKQNEALEIYLYILKNFIPTGTIYYERPIILSKNLKKYKTAIKICELAIKNQEKYNLHFPKEEFELRKNKLLDKF